MKYLKIIGEVVVSIIASALILIVFLIILSAMTEPCLIPELVFGHKCTL